jgi:Arc/MetJ-type ribon-helix-helix transcriptional regulator
MIVKLQPETERLVMEEIQGGRFQALDELIVQGVRALREKLKVLSNAAAPRRLRPVGAKNLAQLFAESPFRGLEMDFDRFPDTSSDL